MNLSQRVENMQFSPIRKFNPIAQKAKDDGKKVYHLNIGQPDVETPSCFMEAVRNFHKKVIAYAESGGLISLQDAIIDYFKDYDIYYTRDDMIITNGGSEALTMIFLALVNDGDDVLIPEPFYTNYHNFVLSAGGNVVPVTTTAEDGYRYADMEKLEAAVTPKTKAICCITPNNPTGYTLSIEEMRVIGEFAKKHDLFIIADEVYREFVYDGRKVTSFGMLDDIADRVVIIDSISKRFSACGARIGCVVSKNKHLMEGIMKIAQGRLCVPTIDQIGATALYKLPKLYYEKMVAEYCSRRDVVYDELMKIPGVVCHKPGGSFYITAKLPVDDIEDFLIFLLSEFDDNGETVMFAPAEGFYATEGLGKNEIRIAYVLNKHDMRRGVELIRLGLEAYNERKN